MEDQPLDVARPIAFRRGRRASLSDQDCEDLVQDVMVTYLRAFDDAVPDNVGAWFETATSHALIDFQRARGRRPADPFAPGEDDAVAIQVAEMRSPEVTSYLPVGGAVLDEALTLLSPADAELFRRRYLEDEPARELAASLGITVATLDQRCTRARRRLRTAVEERPELEHDLRHAHPQLYSRERGQPGR